MAVHPPRWKMAIATWLGVFPTVFVVSQIIGPLMGSVPHVVATGLITLVVVLALTWAVMPGIIKLLRPWLKPEQRDA